MQLIRYLQLVGSIFTVSTTFALLIYALTKGSSLEPGPDIRILQIKPLQAASTSYKYSNLKRDSTAAEEVMSNRLIRTQLPTTDKTSTCPVDLQIDKRHEEWFVERFKPMSPFTDGIYTDLNQSVLILTPISNMADRMDRYFQLLCSLTYPKRRLSVVLGEDSSHDNTYTQARSFVKRLKPHFNRVQLIRLSSAVAVSNTGDERHSISVQLKRRGHLADARNELLRSGLKSEDWVLWLDSDVKHMPESLVEHMLSANKDIVTVNCLYPLENSGFATYDKNTWRETNESLEHLRGLQPDELMLEGYGETKRKYLNDLKNEGRVVRIDGVGGCALMVRAALHRRGLFFPNYVYRHHIETEGLAKMAAFRFKTKMYGLPFVTVMHP